MIRVRLTALELAVQGGYSIDSANDVNMGTAAPLPLAIEPPLQYPVDMAAVMLYKEIAPILTQVAQRALEWQEWVRQLEHQLPLFVVPQPAPLTVAFVEIVRLLLTILNTEHTSNLPAPTYPIPLSLTKTSIGYALRTDASRSEFFHAAKHTPLSLDKLRICAYDRWRRSLMWVGYRAWRVFLFFVASVLFFVSLVIVYGREWGTYV